MFVGSQTALLCAREDTSTILLSPVVAADSRRVGNSSRVSRKGLR